MPEKLTKKGPRRPTNGIHLKSKSKQTLNNLLGDGAMKRVGLADPFADHKRKLLTKENQSTLHTAACLNASCSVTL